MFTTNFTAEEFACNCKCGYGLKEGDVNPRLLDLLEFIRIESGPLHLNSGCRCESWNERSGGSPTSSHKRGNAADLRAFTPQQRWVIITRALAWGCVRFEIGRRYIHIDVDPDLPQKFIGFNPD